MIKTRLSVSSTIQLAHNLGLSVVAEGVETKDVYDRLVDMGCDSVQGYFIEKPLDAASVERLVNRIRVVRLEAPRFQIKLPLLYSWISFSLSSSLPFKRSSLLASRIA